MLNPRVLVMLAGMVNAEAALDTALAALARASRPNDLRFAITADYTQAFAAFELPANALGAHDVKYYDETAGLRGLAALATDETHFLHLRGAHGFADRWDATLLARFAKIPEKRAVMTAALAGGEPDAQAYLPAIHCFTDDQTATIGIGLPLVCSTAPVKTLLIHPAFLMGRFDFLQNADAAEPYLSVAAFATEFAVYALDRAPLWPLSPDGCSQALVKPGPEVLPPPMLARFEQLAGFSFARRAAVVRTMQGLFSVEDAYPQRMPLPLKVSARLSRLQLPSAVSARLARTPRRAAPPAPLTVTAFIDLPDAARPPQTYMIRFHSLMRLRGLPLTVYAGGEMERHLRGCFANTLAYPDLSLLPRALLLQGMTPAELMRRSKLLLLQRALRAYPTQTHAVWLDIDALPHPVCPDAPLAFGHLTDERVHIAWVNGEPDASMVVVPAPLVAALVREVQARTQFDADVQRDMSETALLKHLLEKYPDLFTLHPMPARELLFLTCFDRALLSRPLQNLLADLPAPIRVPPNTPPPKERALHA